MYITRHIATLLTDYSIFTGQKTLPWDIHRSAALRSQYPKIR